MRILDLPVLAAGAGWGSSSRATTATARLATLRERPPASPAASQDDPHAAPTAVGEVLIVEDEVDILESLAAVVALRGYRVATARNGQEALDYLAKAPPPHAILLDLMMPVMDGWEFLRRREYDDALGKVPVFVLSAVAEGEKVALTSATDFLRKPIDYDALFALLERRA